MDFLIDDKDTANDIRVFLSLSLDFVTLILGLIEILRGLLSFRQPV